MRFISRQILLRSFGFPLLSTKIHPDFIFFFLQYPKSFSRINSGRKILLFGSYGWGDGEWMRDWAKRMETAGAVLVRKEGVIANEAPGDEALEECRAAGKELAESV